MTRVDDIAERVARRIFRPSMDCRPGDVIRLFWSTGGHEIQAAEWTQARFEVLVREVAGEALADDGGETRWIRPRWTAGNLAMRARSLTQLPPVARPTDPETSVAAQDAINANGQRRRQCEQIRACLVRHPGGLTAGEIADELVLSCHEVNKRASDLVSAGLAARTDQQRRWPGSGRMQTVLVRTGG